MAFDNSQQYLPENTYLGRGRYRIVRYLGHGGYGITYLAVDMQQRRYVAIKEFFPKELCLRDGYTRNLTVLTQHNVELVGRFKEKFLKEARNLGRCQHPSIVRVYEWFEENNTAYYVMDYIEGRTLSQMVRMQGPLPQRQAYEYIRKIGGALEYLHANRLNHLDVKPANIMIRTSDNQPILIDFGLSKQYDETGSQTSTTPVGISHGYAPIEQYNAGGLSQFSPRVDLYALAATFYYLLTGAVPPQSTMLLSQRLNFPVGFPSQFMGPIKVAMSPNSKERQASIREFLQDLTGATRITPPPPPPPRKSHTARNIFLTLLLLLLMGGAVLLYVYRNSLFRTPVPPESQEVEPVGVNAGGYTEPDPLESEEEPDPDPEELERQRQQRMEKLRDFTTPDLSLFNLHGPVKSVRYTSSETELLPIEQTVLFNSNGRWTNVEEAIFGDKNKNTQISYNRDGLLNTVQRLIRVYDEYDMGYDGCVFTFNWTNNRLSSIAIEDYIPASEIAQSIFFIQYSQGRISGLYSPSYSEGGLYDDGYEATYSNFTLDEWGNWTECTETQTVPEWSTKRIRRIIEYYPLDEYY